MTESASTPRLRATFAIYLALVAATAVLGPRDLGATAYYSTGIAGFLLVVLACLGRLWCSVFIAGHKDESLVTTGPYGRVRHPLYACSMLGAFGLGLTSRSLQRRLKDEGTAFQTLREDVRRELAQRYLSDGLSIAEISFLLGFSEPSAFFRAFKRWTGKTPLESRLARSVV